jgi:hypothetical protein
VFPPEHRASACPLCGSRKPPGSSHRPDARVGRPVGVRNPLVVGRRTVECAQPTLPAATRPMVMAARRDAGPPSAAGRRRETDHRLVGAGPDVGRRHETHVLVLSSLRYTCGVACAAVAVGSNVRSWPRGPGRRPNEPETVAVGGYVRRWDLRAPKHRSPPTKREAPPVVSPRFRPRPQPRSGPHRHREGAPPESSGAVASYLRCYALSTRSVRALRATLGSPGPRRNWPSGKPMSG